MRWFLASFLCLTVRCLLSLRYKVEVRGKENLRKKFLKKDRGTLFLPNHPALVDPIIISAIFWPRFKLHPLVVEYVYRQSGINLIMKLFKALSIPNMDTSLNEIKIKNAQGVIEKIIQGLHKKENYIIYPSGRLKHTKNEIIGGASAAQTILQRCPDINIVLIRTTGLWGSSFSRAYTGRSPDFKSTFLRNFFYLLKNGIFFLPRRKIILEVEMAKEDFPRKGTRLEVNKYLEDWYNRYPVDGKRVKEEPLTLVSYKFWKKEVGKLQEKKKNIKKIKKVEYSSETEEKVFKQIQKLQPDIEIERDLNLATDLGLDSLDIAELISFLSVNFEVERIYPEDIQTVQDVIEIAEGVKRKKKEEVETNYSWPKEKKRPPLVFPEGKTIMQCFLETADKFNNFSVCADDMLGVFSYKKFKLAALILSKEIKKMPKDRIGVLLPASAGAYLVIIAILFAGKIPVLINWTSGPKNIEHMIDAAGVETIISSWKFLEKISNISFGNITSKLRLLEDIKKQISFKDKIFSKILSKRSSKKILKSLKIDGVKEEDICVILFTSGTEANPKGVPLSHKNILENQRAAFKNVHISSEDIIYGILPPFHSFGFSVVGIMPIICGIRVAFFPDPTDSYSIADGIFRWKASIICAAPSFLKGIFQAAKKEHLQTMRLFVTGAEKTPQELFDKVSSLGEDKALIEGYGITECSPIIALSKEGERKGVGKPLEKIEICTVNPDSKELLDSVHIEGEICVRGPNVFSGYLGKEKSPFIKIGQKIWYCTGDLGYLDKENNLILSGRLKRFTKIGGEMISLGEIEGIILQELKKRGVNVSEMVVAACSIERDSEKSEIILFTVISLDKNDVNMILRKAGCSRLVKISKIKKIDQIPLMGTGKVDYRFLQKMIDENI